MTSKVLAIIKREYITRVRKKSFVIMTCLGPLIFLAMFAIPHFFGQPSPTKTLGVVSSDPALLAQFKSNSDLIITPLLGEENVAKSWLDTTEALGVLVIKSNNEKPVYYRKTSHSLVEELMMEKLGRLHSGRDPAEMTIIEYSATAHPDAIKTFQAFGSGMLIYFAIFLYGIQVMKGVIEEKANRIIEVLITAVSPFEMMLGKILGLSLVGLTQFLLWGLCTLIIKNVFQLWQADTQIVAMELALASIRWSVFLPTLLFFFLTGYFLYASLFAIAGAGSDMDTDTQQFVLPITVPLLVSVMSLYNITSSPHGLFAKFMSIFPFTSPICMMARIPFADQNPNFMWELIAAMFLLLLSFVGMTWIAGRVYRIGILSYGKKASFAEMRLWFFTKD